MGPIHEVAEWPVPNLARGSKISYICESGHNSGAKSWVVIRDRCRSRGAGPT